MHFIKKMLSIIVVMAMTAGIFSSFVSFESEAKAKNLYKVAGDSNVTVNQMVKHFKKHAKYPSKVYKSKGAATLKDFCQIVYEESEAEGIRAEVVYSQIIEETGYLRFGGDVKAKQCNFAGLGATGGGNRGETFKTVRKGVRAQVQHLKAYANKKHLNKKCVDKRFGYVQRGTAKYVKWLGHYENPYGTGWAYTHGYGSSLKRIINQVKDC